MHARGAPRKSRREISVGPVRRAHPASGATWNVQVVRGKMTSRCLWHACRALMLGILLMVVGAGMATIGYYAEDLSIGQEVRGNTTVRIKNESRGFHLNNFSYAGPIVMGFGGFIIVAACVMTFEARDSAAKVVPARFKLSTTNCATRTNSSSRRTTDEHGHVSTLSSNVASQTSRMENHTGLFSAVPFQAMVDRETLTATLTNFSKAFGSPRNVTKTRSDEERRVSRSGSVPNLVTDSSATNSSMQPSTVSAIQKGNRCKSQRNSSGVIQHIGDSGSPIPPDTLHIQRHNLSIVSGAEYQSDLGTQSQINDKTKRSDTAKRHILTKQKPIQKDEQSLNSLRKRSTTSDVSHLFRRCNKRQSMVSKTLDNESSPVQADVAQIPKSEIYTPKIQHCLRRQVSAPFVEREFKSQLSIGSEPATSVRTLSCQSSLEPFLHEESTDLDVEIPSIIADNYSPLQIPTKIVSEQIIDPLLLERCQVESNDNQPLHDNKPKSDNKKKIYRSNSSRQAKKSALVETEFQKSCKDDMDYDSIEVIDERRKKNFERIGFHRSNTTVIYSEYVP